MITMKKKEYNEYFNNVEMNTNDYESIKNNILNKKIKRHKMKPLFICIILILLITSSIPPIVAYVINKNIVTYSKEDNPHKNIVVMETEVYTNARLDRKYPEGLISPNELYTIGELEKKLNIKIPKTSYLPNLVFTSGTTGAVSYDGTIGRMWFGKYEDPNSNVVIMQNGTYEHKEDGIDFEMVIYTTAYPSKDEQLMIGVSGVFTHVEEYQIKSLNTTATIIRQEVEERPMYLAPSTIYMPTDYLIFFDYQGISCFITLHEHLGFRNNDVYEFLETLYA